MSEKMRWLFFITRRIAKGLLVVLIATVANFALIHLAPGDPAMVLAGEAGASDPQFIEQLHREFGLDRPFAQQLLIYVEQVASGNLGYSYRQQTGVAELILDRLPATLALTASGYLLALILGLSFGYVAATTRLRPVGEAITVIATLLYATPIFLTGLAGVLVFSVWLGWLPAFGSTSVGADLGGVEYAADYARHLLLPTLTLGLFYVAVYARLTRAGMLIVKDADFIKTARCKGLSPRRIHVAHMLRNALLPIITLAGIQAGQIVGGAVLVETIFAWPGIGRLAFDALLQRDYNVLLGVFLVSSIVVVIFNIVTDIAYTLIDPRIELLA